MKKYLLFTTVFLVLMSGCSKKEPVIDKVEKSKAYVYMDIPENAKDLNDYRDIQSWLPEENMESEIFPYLEGKKINGGTEYIVLNFDSSDAKAVQTKLDEETQKSLAITDKYPPEQLVGGTWSSFQLADYAESDEFISFTVLKFQFVFNSDVYASKATSYVFDKADGTIVKQDDAISRSGYTKEDFEKAFIKVLDTYNENVPEENIYSILTYKPEYFAEDFDTSTLTEEEREHQGLFLRIKPEEGVVVNKDGSLNVLYELRYFEGLNPGGTGHGMFTVPAPQ